MSELTKLLEGVKVEWISLDEISELYGGLKGKNKNDFTDGNAKYVTYKNIFNNNEVNFDTLENVKVLPNENQYVIRYGDVLFTGSSEIASEAGMSSSVTKSPDSEMYLNSFSFGLRFNSEIKLIPEFTKYLFRSKYMRDAIAKTASGVTRYNISKKRFIKLQIPIPFPDNPEKSLKIQQEIVRILDSLSEETNQLTAALQKELDLHQKQYNFYREELFTLEGKDVEWKSLGDTEYFKISAGGTPSKTKIQYWENGIIPWLRSESCNNTSIYKAKDFITEEGLNNSSAKLLEPKSTLIALVGATIFKTGFLEFNACTNQNIASIKSLNTQLINDKYLFVYITSLYNELKSQMKDYGMLNLSTLRQFKIPVPSSQEQERIVKILDDMDAKTQAIISAIKKEITLRNKQYEYYREQLLTFSY
ncbi:restriction endonuclease subunit S [Kaistella palustris]|uniref:restriction endonuclease subunit S n=1 Tax=Kaistella palustris TaxID=493376 RepID=UPI000423B5C9|nr:restriction endonuclease subunit S [Kaistella palustris]